MKKKIPFEAALPLRAPPLRRGLCVCAATFPTARKSPGSVFASGTSFLHAVYITIFSAKGTTATDCSETGAEFT
uniref:Uncharacterized protein n=1 Tax=Podoviridae sp. ctdRZ1 TaxID=2826568 RepID=A0A8S5QLG2_9CAUD|nr:MAG TPA: hypothetical protein [Podoviridae sp. ctdRZ1]